MGALSAEAHPHGGESASLIGHGCQWQSDCASGRRALHARGSGRGRCRPLTACATLLLFLAAVRLAGGEAADDRKPKEKAVEWTRVESTPLRPPARQETGGAGSRVLVGTIVKSTEGVVLRRAGGKDEQVIEAPATGDEVYVGDQFEVGKASAVEMTFGENARIRIGENSIMRVVNKVVENAGAVVRTQRDMELQKGSARVRVKENVRTPSPVLIIAGSMVLTVGRTDAVLERREQESTIMVLRGGAEVVLRDAKSKLWSSGHMMLLNKREKLVVPAEIGQTLPRKEPMGDEEMVDARQRLAFTIEEAREQLPPAPTRDNELDGP